MGIIVIQIIALFSLENDNPRETASIKPRLLFSRAGYAS